MKTYQEVSSQMRSFDVLLFSGRGFISRAIQLGTGSKWSHVALVLRLPQYNTNLVYESTTLSDLPDLTTGACVKGVQLVHLSQRLKSYDGDVAWRPLEGLRTDEMVAETMQFMREFQGRPYEQNQLELLFSAIDLGFDVGNRGEDTSSVFCSEVATLLLRRVGVLEQGIPANEFTPADYSNLLPMAPNFEFKELVPLKI